MHIPDGFLDTPVWVGLAAVSAGVVGHAAARASKQIEARKVPLMGVMAAFVFAAQMVNFPVAPGISGHVVGAVLLAVLLGPQVALVVITSVLIVQCLLFQDGGVTALGANVFNMGIVGTYIGYGIYSLLRQVSRSRAGWYLAVFVGCWWSVVFAAAMAATELAVSSALNPGLRVVAPRLIYPLLLAPHTLIGVGEGLLSIAALRVVVAVRPDLVPALREPAKPRLAWAWGLVAALAVAGALSPFASRFPDGLEWAAAKLGIEEPATSAPMTHAPMPGYSMPGVAREGVSTSLAGVIGTGVAFVAAAGVLSLIALRRLRAKRGDAKDDPGVH
jgi:cobalt/nickel transport system permease protein